MPASDVWFYATFSCSQKESRIIADLTSLQSFRECSGLWLSVEEMIRSKTPKGETPICIFKVSQGDLFKEKKMWSGLVWGHLAILKINRRPIMSNSWGWFFSCSQGQKKFKCSKRYSSARTKKLNKMKVRKPKKKFRV